MKTTKTLVLALGVLLLTVSCKKDEVADAAAAGAGGSTTVTRDLFRLWTNSNGAFTYDLRLGNLTGANFNAYISSSAGDVCTCVTTITGTQTLSAFTSTCTLTTNVTALDCTAFNTSGSPTLTNSNGVLAMKRTTNGTPFLWPN